MNKADQKRYAKLYRQHVNALTRQGKSDNTIQSYARALRRITEYFDCCPDCLTFELISVALRPHFTKALMSATIEHGPQSAGLVIRDLMSVFIKK